MFKNLHDLHLGSFARAFGIARNTHLVAIHGMTRIAVGQFDGLSPFLGLEEILVPSAQECANHLCAPFVESVSVSFDLYDVLVFCHVIQDVETQHLHRVSLEMKLFKNRPQRENFFRLLME